MQIAIKLEHDTEQAAIMKLNKKTHAEINDTTAQL
jgi:hypothetical protein